MKGGYPMILENYYGKNTEIKDDRSMKIFEKSDAKDKEIRKFEVFLDNDDSKMKIYTMS